MAMAVLTLPGIGGSGPEHWQSHWERTHPRVFRVNQRDWDNPACDEWVAALDAAVRCHGPDVVLAAHSLSCLVVAHWATRAYSAVAGALLVAVPDSGGPAFPRAAHGFEATPARRLPFPNIVVVSADDPYGSRANSERLARAWGSDVVNIGNRGHINSESGLGPWPEGYALLGQLLARAA